MIESHSGIDRLLTLFTPRGIVGAIVKGEELAAQRGDAWRRSLVDPHERSTRSVNNGKSLFSQLNIKFFWWRHSAGGDAR